MEITLAFEKYSLKILQSYEQVIMHIELFFYKLFFEHTWSVKTINIYIWRYMK